MRTTIIRLRAVAATLAALLLLSMPVTADTDLGDGGAVGRHHLRDTRATPGAICTYADVDGDMVLQSITVRPPVVFARDRTAGRDGQMVAWRIQLLAWVPDPEAYWIFHLAQVAAGPIHRAWATDLRPAAFSADTIAIDQLHRAFQVRVRMTWFRASDPTEPAGTSRHVVEWHAVEGSTPWEWCVGVVY